MVKKGKEIDLGGIRLQVDPLILARRVMTRQKKLLAAIAVIGGAATILAYVKTPKLYRSKSSIAISVAAVGGEVSARALVNRAMRGINSDGEIMLIINELDLYPSMRGNQPYEMALRTLRRELGIANKTGVINVSYQSRDPVLAQKVVAFATERVLTNFVDLLDAPYIRELDSLQRAITKLDPDVEKAQKQLFEFKAKHPKIAVRAELVAFLGTDPNGPDSELKRAQRALSACYGKKSRGSSSKPAACKAVAAARKKLSDTLNQFMPSHPTAIAAKKALEKQKAACKAAQSKAAGPPAGMSQAECVAQAKGRISAAASRRVDKAKQISRKPTLQRAWKKLQTNVTSLDVQMGGLKRRLNKVTQDRVVAAGNFEEKFNLVDAAKVPTLPSFPDRNQFMIAGMIVTAAIGILIALIREALRQSFVSPTEFEEQTGLQVLAVLPDISRDA